MAFEWCIRLRVHSNTPVVTSVSRKCSVGAVRIQAPGNGHEKYCAANLTTLEHLLDQGTIDRKQAREIIHGDTLGSEKGGMLLRHNIGPRL